MPSMPFAMFVRSICVEASPTAAVPPTISNRTTATATLRLTVGRIDAVTRELAAFLYELSTSIIDEAFPFRTT